MTPALLSQPGVMPTTLERDEMAKRTARPIEERFWEKVDLDGPAPDYAPQLGPCWLWRGRHTYRDPEPEVVERSCGQCRWCYTQDEGYSSYTVEGTRVYCLKNQHPSGPEGFDQWYGEDKRMLFATECKFFTEGGPVHADVDREEADWKSDEPWWWSYTKDDDVQRALMDAFLAPTPSNGGSPRA